MLGVLAVGTVQAGLQQRWEGSRLCVQDQARALGFEGCCPCAPQQSAVRCPRCRTGRSMSCRAPTELERRCVLTAMLVTLQRTAPRLSASLGAPGILQCSAVRGVSVGAHWWPCLVGAPCRQEQRVQAEPFLRWALTHHRSDSSSLARCSLTDLRLSVSLLQSNHAPCLQRSPMEITTAKAKHFLPWECL